MSDKLKTVREALERIANDLSPNSLPIDAVMEGPNGMTVRVIADRCFDDAKEALAALSSMEGVEPVKVLTFEERPMAGQKYTKVLGIAKDLGKKHFDAHLQGTLKHAGPNQAYLMKQEFVAGCIEAMYYLRDHGYLAPSAPPVELTEEEVENEVDQLFGNTESVVAFHAARRAMRHLASKYHLIPKQP